jgi:multisubunit Na+/H+ antiporter MnhE subunit
MNLKKVFYMLLFSLIFGFSCWYLVFSFLSSNFNPFEWNIWFKIFYLIFSLSTSNWALKRVYPEGQE